METIEVKKALRGNDLKFLRVCIEMNMINLFRQKLLAMRSLPQRLRDIESQLNLIHNKATSQELQLLIKLKYLDSLTKGSDKQALSFEHVGFRVYSQFEEDGILLYIFSLIGTTNKKVVEMCSGDGRECMATNLLINHGWDGYLFDGSNENVELGQYFFSSHKDTFLIPPKFEQAWITAENVNSLLEHVGVVGEVDLLSLDVDGMDYWIWNAIESIQPRVCVFETHNVIPSHLSLTAKYDPNFCYLDLPPEERDYRSASLLAMTELSRSKGYRLVGSHRHGFNCFFMRNDVGQDLFPEVGVEACHKNPYTVSAQKYRWPKVQHLDWQEV